MDPAITLATLDRGLGHDLAAQTDVGTGKVVIGKDAEVHIAAREVVLGVEVVIHPERKKGLIPVPRESLIPDLQAPSIEGQSLVLLLEMVQVLIPVPEVGLAHIPGILSHPLLEGSLLHHPRHQLGIIPEARVQLSTGPIPVPGAGVVHPANPAKYHRTTKLMKSM